MKKLFFNKIVVLAGFILLGMLHHGPVHADIVVLKDGTVLVGKVVEEKEDTIYLKNSYKLFEIKKAQIRNTYITHNYKEDVDIYKGLGLKADEVVIKKDYLAGLEKQARKESAKTVETWNGRAALLSCFYGTAGDLRDKIPYSYGFIVSYDQNLYGFDFLQPLMKDKYLPFIPYLRAEIEYNRYQKNQAILNKAGFFVGPVWTFPIIQKEWGYLHFSTLPGISYLDAAYQNRKKTGCTYGQNTFLGYEYTEGMITLYAHFRYIFIADQSYNLHGVGMALGAGYKIW